MKKLAVALPLALLLAFSFGPFGAHTVHAVQLCPSGNDNDCDDIGGVTYECDTSVNPFICVAAGAGVGSGTVGQGGVCKVDGDCQDNLACTNGTCQVDNSLEDPGTNPATPGSTATPGTPAGGSGTFVPLVKIPGLTDVPTNNLALFFNDLYKFCIGAAAVLAILEITMGGFQVMSGDSVTAHSAGRERIMGAVLGLILVLSPFLVFSIINPGILSLQINTSTLQPTNTSAPTTSGNGPVNTGSGSNSGTGSTGSGGSPTSGQAPAAPSNLQATQTATSVSLSWSAPSGGTAVAKYDVYDGEVLTQSVTGTTATISGLAAGSQHSFSVKAEDANGNVSSASNLETVTVAGSTDNAPDGSEGSWAFSYWEYRGNENCGSFKCSETCWDFVGAGNSTNVFPVPYEGQGKDAIQQVCQNSLTSEEQSNQYPTNPTKFYSCTFLNPGQSLTPPQAPGPTC